MRRASVFAIAVLCLILIVSMMISVSAAVSYLRGDANGDEEVTITDATVIQRKIADIAVPYFDEAAADVDGEGLDITDATWIQRYIADMDNIYHINEIVTVTQPPKPISTDPYELPFIPKK